jgi:hypothetical protein
MSMTSHQTTLPAGPVVDSLRVGSLTVAAIFARPEATGGSPSGETMRLAEMLVAATVGVPHRFVRVATLSPSGRPVAALRSPQPAPFVSVSHVEGLIGAAASGDGPIGIDIVAPNSADDGLDLFFSAEELSFRTDGFGPVRAMLWAAKEAAYKASQLDAEYRPRQIEIQALSPRGFEWVICTPYRNASGVGSFAMVAGHVVAFAAMSVAGSLAARHTTKPLLQETARCF